MNEHISREGITRDLEAMRAAGIGEAFIGNIYWNEHTERGNVRTLSDEWFDCMRFALTEGERTGVKVSTFNCPGWSQAGGPWVKPEDAMRYLTFSEQVVDGGGRIKVALPKPKAFFQDVAVIAAPVPVSENSTVKVLKKPFSNLPERPATLTFSFPQPVLRRALVIYPDAQPFRMHCEVFARQDAGFRLVAAADFDRTTDLLAYGPEPFAPLCISLGETVAGEFKVVMSRVPANFTLKSVELTAEPKIAYYSEKLNNKMPNLATPDWFAYQWRQQQEPPVETVTDVNRIVDVTQYLAGDTLTWQAPAGRWRLMRLGMAPTMKTNTPAAPDATGLEIDKMSRRAIQRHYDSYVGKIVGGLPGGQMFHRIVADSYETGPGSWSDDFREIFQQTYGYDPLPWLAVFSGQTVGSADQSDRFLWDLRRLVADRIASEFVGGMAEIAHRNGSGLWLENYGWNGFPSEFLKYAKLSPAVAGEFWTTEPNTECRLAASACHIYDKNTVYAESYTTGGWRYFFELYPELLKFKGDEAYCEGINQHIMHVFIHQPYADRAPGVNSWFGLELNHHNTWFEASKAWFDYQRRCCFMLQQGLPAADVCFFIGEDCPKMAGWKDSTLSAGYDYDFINADVIINDMTVRKGRLTLPSGVSYAMLALPPLTTMRPELLEKIEKLVGDGAMIIGNPPEKSPSLQDFPECDRRVREIAARLWGKGKIFYNTPINEALAQIGAPEAVRIDSGVPVRWKQRDLPGGRRIYFVCNQSDSVIDFNISFRTEGFQPEFWDAIDGTTRKLFEYTVADGYTTLPLHLDKYGSGFVVFGKKGSKESKGLMAGKSNFAAETTLVTLSNRWDISFENRQLGEKYSIPNSPLFEWTRHAADSIRCFSGTAVYRTVIKNLNPGILNAGNLNLKLDSIGVIATVLINGQEAGTVWTKPYRVNIDGLLHEGDNEIEIRVSNVWRNRIVDKLYHNKDLPLWMLCPPEHFGDYGRRLVPSGIWGEVKIVNQ
jgi:hypothetical protein